MNPQNMIKDKQQHQKAAIHFFDILFEESLRNGRGEIQIDGFDNGPRYQSYHGNIPDAVNAAYQACQQGLEVYFGINPRIGQVGGKENVHFLVSFHAEVDYGQAGHKKPSYYPSYNPALIRKRIDAVNRSGVVGERNVIAMYFAALDSRLLPEDTASPNALAIKNTGHHGSGKSFTMKKCLELYPEEAYHLITSGSAKSLYYLPKGLKHKCLIVAEAFQFQANNAGDSEFVYVVRSLLSEGCVSYQVPQKDEDGKFITVEKRLDGPTSFITTTIIDKLEPQLEDRLFTIHPDESMGQTRSIMTMTARIKEGSFEGIDEQAIDAWKHFHALLKPVSVVIPYAGRISDYLQRGERLPIATRRAFNRVMAIIQTVACAYQFQRSKDSKSRLIAEMCDYWMALQIVREAFRETLGHQSKEAAQRIEYIRQNGPVQYGALKSQWGVTKSALTGWVRGKLYDNILSWCDEDGVEFQDDAALKKAKHSGKAYLKINDDFQVDDVTGLPTPFELTADPDWNEGGKLYQLFDLALDRRPAIENVTVDDEGAVENTMDDAIEGPVEVFSFDDIGLSN